MRIIAFSSLDSTSSKAAELLAKGEVAPFMVTAAEQTAGRGRRGHTWHSPVGNLYATVVLAPTGMLASQASTLPLRAGLVVALLLQKHVRFRATLKWPNDLLFAGAKLGGLLLESAVSGQTVTHLFIGIGLNIEHAPDFKTLATELRPGYAATCLKAVLGAGAYSMASETATPAANLARLFADDWLNLWDELGTAPLSQLYAEFGLAKGSLWASEGQCAVQDELLEDGSLVLRLLCNGALGEAVTLSSIDHGWRPQQQMQGPLLLADVGNTAIKLAFFADQGQRLAQVIHCPRPQDQSEVTKAALTSALQQLKHMMHTGDSEARLTPSFCPPTLHILSVRPEATRVLSEAARELDFLPLVISKRPVRRFGKGYKLSDLGIDRLALIEAWLDPCGRCRELMALKTFGSLAARALTNASAASTCTVLVSAGTATTIDALSESGEHLGGLIMPGMQLALESLHQSTGLLPRISAEQARAGWDHAHAPLKTGVAIGSVDRLGHDTLTAMLEASLVMTEGAVRSVVQQLRDAATNRPGDGKAHGNGLNALPVTIIVTGGFGELLAQRLDAVYDSGLILEGARILALGGQLPAP